MSYISCNNKYNYTYIMCIYIYVYLDTRIYTHSANEYVINL